MQEAQDHDTLPPSMDPREDTHVLAPPTTIRGILRKLGPGLIIAGSIVGSGELIATTKTGAQAGITLLWLIIIGCVIKVFVQLELGRYTITHGETTLAALDQVPGHAIGIRAAGAGGATLLSRSLDLLVVTVVSVQEHRRCCRTLEGLHSNI